MSPLNLGPRLLEGDGARAETWSALVEDERTQVLIRPFVGFFDLDEHGPYETLANLDDLLAARFEIPRGFKLCLRGHPPQLCGVG
jgi:hypothetical protein